MLNLLDILFYRLKACPTVADGNAAEGGPPPDRVDIEHHDPEEDICLWGAYG